LKPNLASKREWLNPSSFVSTEANFTTSSDEDTHEEYFFTSSTHFSTRKNKQAKSSHPNNWLVVSASIFVSQEEHLLKALDDIDASSSVRDILCNQQFSFTRLEMIH
jgi:hypothetical protein